MSNPNFDEILTTTFNKHRSAFVDQVFGARPLTFFLMQAGQIRMVDGGAKIVEPLIVANNSTVETYAQGDTLNPADTSEFSAAEYDWKMIVASITIHGLEEAKNAGTSRILDLLEGKIMVARESITEKFNQDFHSGTTTAPTGGNWNNLGYLLGQNGAVAVGGIAPNTNTYWQSNIDSAAEAITTAAMTTSYNNASVGNDQPNMVLTTQTLYEAYEALLQPQLRYQSAEVADAGFQNLMFKGAPVLYDADCASGHMWMLNTKYLKLIGHSQKWFTPSPFIRTTTEDSRTAQIFCYGNLIVNNRKRQAVLTGKTAS